MIDVEIGNKTLTMEEHWELVSQLAKDNKLPDFPDKDNYRGLRVDGNFPKKWREKIRAHIIPLEIKSSLLYPFFAESLKTHRAVLGSDLNPAKDAFFALVPHRDLSGKISYGLCCLDPNDFSKEPDTIYDEIIASNNGQSVTRYRDKIGAWLTVTGETIFPPEEE